MTAFETTDSIENTNPTSGPNPGPDEVADEVADTDPAIYRPAVAHHERRDVVPGWLRDRESRGDAVRWAAGYGWHWVGFHTVRLPAYYARLARLAPFGMFRVVAVLGRWVGDTSWRDDRAALLTSVSSDSRGADALYRLRLSHARTVRFRLTLAAIAVAVVSMVLVGWLRSVLSDTGAVVSVLVAIGVLGWLGRSPDVVITDRAADSAETPRLTHNVIVDALASLGLAKINQAVKQAGDKAFGFPSPIVRHGPGWRADIDLPLGVTAGQIIDRRDALASGLRRKLGCVWPEGDPNHHEGRLVLFVGDKTLAETTDVTWPLLKADQVDLFDPFPVGVNQQGSPVTATLMYNNALIGAIPGQGKTFLLRLLCLAAALDVRTELHIFNFKGSPDFEAFETVSHSYRNGPGEDDVAYTMTALRNVQADMERRYRTLTKLPKAERPGSKVNTTLASRRSLGLWPVVVAIDEAQRLFEHPDHAKESAAICADVVRRGRAVGIILLSATQRPDANSIPKAIGDNVVLRFCLKVQGNTANDMVLGTSAYKAGYRATMFARTDLGIAYFAGEGSDPVIVKTSFVDDDAAEEICDRAAAAKRAAGRLTGYAADEDNEPEWDSRSIIDHLDLIWPEAASRVWWDTLAERLVEVFPAIYHGWGGDQVAAALRGQGVTSVQIKRQGTNKRGMSRTDLDKLLTTKPTNPVDGGSG